MPKYRNSLPQLSGDTFLTDGGLETTLIFHQGIELPLFAAFDLLKNDEGRSILRDYYVSYVKMAKSHGVGFVFEGVTWRANSDWGKQLNYSEDELARENHSAIELMDDIRKEFEDEKSKMVLSGCIGPRGDGYKADDKMNAEQAQSYHSAQIKTFADTAADLISAMTITYTAEAIGITNAAVAAGMPVVISFTVETDGKLPSGQTLESAIKQVDEATDNAPAYYMINCAHPDHFEDALGSGETWLERIRGIRANASRMSHAELDESETLDDGNPQEFGQLYRELRKKLPKLNILGGCCGTDQRHVEQICKSCLTDN
jgi:S-methylmethionine-dependent homocysteine/selenocysteine methylase